jgi:hypothetical protein
VLDSLFLLVLDMKVEENKETPNLLSFPIRFVCGISHAGVNYSTNLAINLAGVLYFGIFFKKLYLLYIGTEKVQYNSCSTRRTLRKKYTSQLYKDPVTLKTTVLYIS